jgi:hypothetical protein
MEDETMAKVKTRDTATAVPDNGGPDPLAAFLGLFQNFITELTNGARTTLGNGDGIVIADALSTALQSQVIELNGFITTQFNSMSTRTQADVFQVLKMSSGGTLLQAAIPATQAPLTPGVAFGLSDIVHLIKKILFKILDLLGVQLSHFLLALIELLDELINALFGSVFRELRAPLSVAQQGFLGEVLKLRQLEAFEESRINFEEDDSK